MTFEEFQIYLNARMFSERRILWAALQVTVSARMTLEGRITDFTLAYPDVFLFVEPEDFDKAVRVA